MEEIGERLKCFRKAKNKTQEEISKVVNLSRTGYYHIEKDHVAPSANVLIALSDYYQTTIDKLIGRDFEDTSNLPPMNQDQTVAVKMLLRLNKNNFVQAYSFVAGLLADQQ